MNANGAAERSPHPYRARTGVEAEGWPLAMYLASRYPHSSAEAWAARILAGRVTVDARPSHPEVLLRRGQVIVWLRPPWSEPEAPTAFAVVHQDEHLLAVAKPAGLPVLPGAGFLSNTLLNRVRAYDPKATPLHRLGRHTSGIVLFARDAEARRELSRQWAAREVRKRYRALASGRPERDAFVVTTPIGPVPHALLGSVHAAAAAGKPAHTEVAVVDRRNGEFLCDVRIATGRPHQIRIHLAAAGHPLVGDPLYGPGGVPPPDSPVVPGDPGYLLHAAELSFRHPATGRETTIACAPPPALRR